MTQSGNAKYTGPIWRGVDYSPTWPTWEPGTQGTQTGDSDFANDAFASLWGKAYQAAPANDPSQPHNNGRNYRNDLATIADAGFNLVRLYNWDMARGTTPASNVGLDHVNFLDYAHTLGLKVVVPVSDYFLCDDKYAWNNQAATLNYDYSNAPAAIQTDFEQFIASITDPKTGRIHTAVHSISVGNEGDIGQGLNEQTTPSNFLYRTIWWIVNLHQQINGSGATGPDGQPVVNGPTPIVRLTATFSNGDQGLGNGSWFGCVINGASQGQTTPTQLPGQSGTFGATVTGLSAADATWATYYYNSTNISQVSPSSPFSNSLAATLKLYDQGATPWPGANCTVPLLLMEVFTPNRDAFPTGTDQAAAAVGQVEALETYLAHHEGGTVQSSTYLMGYNYFEFNDEPQKETGLFQFTQFTTAKTGATSVFYSPYSFPTADFPVYALTPTPGPQGSGTLVEAIAACFPMKLEGQIVARFGDPGDWRATFYTGTPIPYSVVAGGAVVLGSGIPQGTTVAPTEPSPATPVAVVLENQSPTHENPFSPKTTEILVLDA